MNLIQSPLHEKDSIKEPYTSIEKNILVLRLECLTANKSSGFNPWSSL